MIKLKECDMTKPFIFVSYSKQDADMVYPVIEALQADSCNIWIDKELNKAVGKSWQKEAFDVLRDSNCKAILFFMSCNSMWSAPVCAELHFSHSETVRDNNEDKPLKIIPINTSKTWTYQSQSFHDWVYSGELNTANAAKKTLAKSDYEVLRLADVDEKYTDTSKLTVFREHKDIAKYIYKNELGQNPDQITIANINDFATIKDNIPNEAFTLNCSNSDSESESAVASVPPTSAMPQTFVSNITTAPAEGTQKRIAKKQKSITGDITFTLYGKEYTMNQSDMMLSFFAQVLNRHQEFISKIISYKGMNCVSDINYTLKENRTDEMMSYFRICQYFTFPNGESLCVGTAYSINDKLKKMALLLSICGEDPDIFQSAQVSLPIIKSGTEKGGNSHKNSSSVAAKTSSRKKSPINYFG